MTGAADRVRRLRRGVTGYVARPSPPRRAGRRPEALLFGAGQLGVKTEKVAAYVLQER